MINIFQVASNDQSIVYLGQIFGNVGIALSGTGPALLGVMFKTFNTVLLAFGALIVTYTTVVGVLQTAQEGEFLGKKWHALWVPLRTVGGIAALFPTSTGYCALQVVIMWFIVQGVGAADMVWKAAIDYVGTGGPTTPQTPPADFFNAVPNLMTSMFASAVCQAAAVKFQSNNANAVATTAVVNQPPGAYMAFNFGRPQQTGDDSTVTSECGIVQWGSNQTGSVTQATIQSDVNNLQSNPTSTALQNQLKSDIATLDQIAMQEAQTQALKTILPVIEALANHFVNQVIADPNCWLPCGSYSINPMTLRLTFTPGQCAYFGKVGSFNPTNPQCIANNPQAAWQELSGFAGSNFVTDASTLFTGYALSYATTFATIRANANSNIPGTNITNFSGPSADTWKRAEANGWILAGAYYYYIANTNNNTTADYTSFINGVSVTSPQDMQTRYNPSDTTYSSYPDLNYVKYPVFAMQTMYCGMYDTNPKNFQNCQNTPAGGALAISSLAQSAMNTAGQIGGTLPNNIGEGSGPVSAIRPASSSLITTWMSNIASTSNNPIVSISNFGQSLLTAAETLFWIFFVVGIGLGLASTPVQVIGTTVNFAGGIMQNIFTMLLPTVMMLIGYMISIGGMLGVYVPLIPYTFFTFGAIAWMIAVIDAMVAGPIIALGILSPGGQHEILSRAEPAVMILLNVILRPTLMVFGMMAAMLLSTVVIQFINAAFVNVVASIMTGSTFGLIEGFLFIMAYVGLVIAALNKCFALIYMIPDQALRWIGGHAESIGEKTAEAGASEMKGKVSAGGEAASGASKSALGAGEATAGAKAKMKEEGKKTKLGS